MVSNVNKGDEEVCAATTPTTKKRKFAKFIRKYFLEGQKLEREVHQVVQNNDVDKTSVMERYRKYIGFLMPMCFMQTVWWTLAIRYNIFRLYPTRYELPITMIVGATVAGMTSEGGGAIAFPVMTLLLHIDAAVSRDFSLMIQSCGMTSAAFTIIWMKIVIEWHSVVFCSLGAVAGIVFGFHVLDPLMTGAQKKMFFVSIWFSFALSLFILNTRKKRRTFENIPNFCSSKALILLLTGLFGGLCSAFVGSGVDICSFSILTLLFRITEKVATPTSVILMAVNTCVGFFWRQLIMCDISQLAWEYFEVSVPVVVIFAPLGSLIGSHFHRLVLASFVYLLETVALIGFLFTRPPVSLVIVGVAIIIFSLLFFLVVGRLGAMLARKSRSMDCNPEVKTSSSISIIEDKTFQP
uniref:Membrane transporter protein n=2 Tax=Parascaris univalens TaxID=6257 RepID=A0A914ZMR9_PARUN